MASDALLELLQATLALTLAVAIVLALRRPLRRWLGAKVAYAAWAMVPMAVVAVLLPAPGGDAGTAVVTDASMVFAALPAAATRSAGTMAAPILSLWLLGAAALVLLMALRQRRFSAGVRRHPTGPFDSSEWATPAVTGLFRPRIVLPADFGSRYTPGEQRLVIAHEQLHIERGDLPAQAMASLLRCVFWFNPLVHLAAARFRFDQELACDAAVLARFPESRRSYGDAMFKTQLAEAGLPLGCHWQSSHPLKERITMLKHPLPGPLRRRSGQILLAALLAAATWAAWAVQPAGAAATSRPLSTLTADDVLTPPAYPADALAEKLSGQVILDVLVGTDGRAKEIKVFRSEPAGRFDQAAIDAVGQWRFNAGRDGASGEKVEGWVRIPVRFDADKSTDGAAPEAASD